MITWRNFIRRKGLTVERWVAANGVTDVKSFRVKAAALKFAITAADEADVKAVLKPSTPKVVHPGGSATPESPDKAKERKDEIVKPAVEVEEEESQDTKPRRRRRKVTTEENPEN